MARYIDVEPLEDKLKEHIKKTESELMLGALSTFLRVLDITPTIDAVPATIDGALGYLHKVGWIQEHDKELTQRTWIPCEERLPEPTQEVLVTGTNSCVYTSRIVHGEFEYGGNVVAWMPLPEPYKGEREDDE